MACCSVHATFPRVHEDKETIICIIISKNIIYSSPKRRMICPTGTFHLRNKLFSALEEIRG